MSNFATFSPGLGFFRSSTGVLLFWMATAGVAFGDASVSFHQSHANLFQSTSSPISEIPKRFQEQVVANPSPPFSKETRGVLNWIHRSNNNSHLPFLLVDKQAAAVHVFTADGSLLGSSPVLLGMARGDESPMGIGERSMSKIAPHERITPAGRFLSEPGRNLQNDDIVWIHYDDAVSMHRLRASKAAERRPQRLASQTTNDNRISYGCVNVLPAFYDRFIAPVFGQRVGVIYVLPETSSAASFFGFAPSSIQ